MRRVRLDVASDWLVRQNALGYLASCDGLGLVVSAGDYVELQERIAAAMRRHFEQAQHSGRLETTLERLGSTAIICPDSPRERIAIDAPWTLRFESMRGQPRPPRT